MVKIKADTYCEDIRNILNHVNEDNFELATQAIATISKYAHELTEDEQASQTEVKKSEKKPAESAETTKAVTEKAVPEKTVTEAAASEAADDLFKIISTKARHTEKKASSPANKYKVGRKLIGAKIGPQYYSESMVRKLGLHGGDMVTLTPDPSMHRYYHGKLPQVSIVDVNPVSDQNIVREKAIVDKDDDDHFVAKYQYNHEPILVDGEPSTIKLNDDDAHKNHIEVGDIIELAYYTPNEHNEARVTWKYDILADEPAPTEVKKPHAAYSEKTERKIKAFQPNMEYDLTNKKVLMCGYGNHRSIAQEVVDAHHAKELLMYDEKVSGKGMAGNLLTAIKHADIVIVMLNSISHHTANQAISIARDQNKLVSATNTNSPLAIEEAIDRALKREPIYMPASHVIE